MNIPLDVLTTSIGGVVATLSTCVGIYVTLNKHLKENKEERIKLLEHQYIVTDSLKRLTKDIDELVKQNDNQQRQIEATESFAKSHFRMELYNALTKALERGYTFVDEATEIAKMYTIYRQNGGNGEIELLFLKYDKLEIKEERYNDV